MNNMIKVFLWFKNANLGDIAVGIVLGLGGAWAYPWIVRLISGE